MVNSVHKKIIQKYYSVRAEDYDKQKTRTWKSDQGFGTEVFDALLDAFEDSENKKLLETHGFNTSRMKTIAYRKAYDSLIDGKARYFGITPEALHKYIEKASKEAKQQYSLTCTELTLFYTVIVATKRIQSV